MAKNKSRKMTNAERSRLLKNPYVYNATPHSIRFTEEGKWKIWEGLLSGKSCIRVLLDDVGLPPIDHVFDMSRHLARKLKRELAEKGSFSRVDKREYAGVQVPKSEEEARLREELLIKSQELEFVKKITRKARGGK